MLEATAAVLVRPSRRLHDPVERQIREDNDFAHEQFPPHFYLYLVVVYSCKPFILVKNRSEKNFFILLF